MKIQQWLNKGYGAKEIALMWNGGEPKVKKGINKYGQHYDTELYALTVLSHL